MNGAATQIASRQFDADFFKLPSIVREQVQRKIDEVCGWHHFLTFA